jgi:uncharacterized protein (DUF2384 family)
MDKAVTCPPSLAEVLESAYKRSAVAPAHEAARELIDTVGVRVAAAAVGLKDGRTIRGWARGTEPRDQVEAARLRLLHRIVLAITDVYERPAVATAFLTSASPALDDEAPLVVLAEQPLTESEKPLLAALRGFLAD